MSFSEGRLIRFSHCDPAGIVYFVNFFNMIKFAISGSVAGQEKFRARHKVALVSLDTFRPLPIPEDIHAKMRDFVL